MHFSFATFVAASFIGLASACNQKPVGSNPSGNPIGQPITTSTVTAGQPFTITWTPTTKGTVSLVLLRGPSENVIPIDCLGDNIPNTGTFTWTPSTSLEADTTHYGLQIIVTGTGQFQYSTQFGIVNSKPIKSSSSAEPVKSTTSAKPHTTPGSKYVSVKADGQPTIGKTTDVPVIQISDGQPQVHTTAIPTFTATLHSNFTHIRGTGTAPFSVGTGTGAHNSTIILPTRSLSVPHSLQTPKTTLVATGKSTATTSSGVAPTNSVVTANPNGAGRAFAAGSALGMVGVVIAMVL